ncbi:MAG: hypothetical protein WDW38_005957 [Sanguina aurantia]
MPSDSNGGEQEVAINKLPCARCQAPAQLQCPNCLKNSLPKATSVFCTQECFKLAWPEHKKIHTGTLVASDAWLYVTKRGAARSGVMPDFAWTGALRPHPVSSRRAVPSHIVHPDYAVTGVPISEEESRQQQSVIPRSGADLEGLRRACRVGREVLDVAHAAIRPGITTDEIDRIVHEATIERGAYPSPLNYYNFPKSVCTSVNEVICHGIPDKRELQNGDIVNVDVTAFVGGYHGDLNETFVVGEVDAVSKQLIKVTHECLAQAIAACKPGVRYRDMGDIISKHAKGAGFQVVKAYCGHGIGDLFHCAPNIPHYSPNKAVGVMKEGHVFTIEPMVNVGSWKDDTWPDQWTAVTKDGSRSAQFEHTLVVTKDGTDVLTKRLPTSPPLWWEV